MPKNTASALPDGGEGEVPVRHTVVSYTGKVSLFDTNWHVDGAGRLVGNGVPVGEVHKESRKD